MAEQGWSDKLLRKLRDNLSGVIEEMDDNKLKDALREGISLEEIVREILQEDNSFRTALKKKISETLAEIVNRIDEFDFDGETFEDLIKIHIDFRQMIETLIDSDSEVKQAIRDKVKKVLIEGLENLTEEDLPDWENILEVLGINDIIKRISQDVEFQSDFSQKIRELLDSDIENNLDYDDMPEWEKLMELVGIHDFIKTVSKSADFQIMLKQKIGEFLADTVSGKLNEGDLPKDYPEIIGLNDQIRSLLTNKETKQYIGAKLQETLKTMLLNLASGRSPVFASILENNPTLKSLFSRQVAELSRDPKFASRIRSQLKYKLTGKEDLGMIAERLLKGVLRG